MANTKGLSGSYGLRSISPPKPKWPHLELTCVCDDGPKDAVGRTMSMRLNELDINWVISSLAADDRFAEKMKSVVVLRESLLAEAETASPVRQVRILNHLSSLLLEHLG
jgi:hypothetical protein